FATNLGPPEIVRIRFRARIAASFPKQERKMIAPHGVKFMLLAAGLLVAGSVWAQAPGERGPEGMGPMLGLERLHKEVNLNAHQEELWKRAQAAQREAHRSMRAQGEETRAQLRAEIDKPGADLK